MSIKIIKDGIKLDHKRFLFPSGEIGVKLDMENYKFRFHNAKYQWVIARIQNSDDLLELVMVVDALRRIATMPIRLFMPYVPYARQDRVCVPGESFSLKAFASIINSLQFESVTIVDPHSDVCGAVFDNVIIVTQSQVIQNWDEFSNKIKSGMYRFVSPDAGSNKKTSELATYFNHKEFFRADKNRDLETGTIKETTVYGDVEGRFVAICDDICDGGRTFIELAKALKAKGAAKVILYVTHGIFTKGTKVLFHGGIDEIFNTNSYYETWPADVGDVKTFNLEESFIR